MPQHPNEVSSPEISLGHFPSSPRWSFDASVASCFDDMLARSIPQYGVMRQACFDVGQRFVKAGTDIVDLGCSKGAALAPFAERFATSNRLIGVEVSEPMRISAIDRFTALVNQGASIQILNTDLRREYPAAAASLTLAVLTLQFVPIEYRQSLVSRAYASTISGGAMIVVEKLLGQDAEMNDVMVDTYYEFKRGSGYTQEEIDRKRYSLEGVLVPVTAKWNEDLLRAAGFSRVECFWRWMNFGAWLAVK